jgi:ABC-type dipeptide/oligopeptide/nickel transport system ATPase subunit
MGQIAGLMTQYHNALTALAALEQIVTRPVERPEGAHFLSRQALRGDIEFRDVSFSYPTTEMNALRGVSFRITAGEKIGILGRTGSGKSTLLRLIMGLYRPITGAVLVDGIDVRQLDPAELRRNIGYVPQDVNLFYGTLRDNVSMGASQIEDADIVRALHLANLSEFVNQHPRGIEHAPGVPDGDGLAIGRVFELLDLQDLAHRLRDGQIARGEQDHEAVARLLVDDHLAKGADLVETGVGARVGQEDQSRIELDAYAIGHGAVSLSGGCCSACKRYSVSRACFGVKASGSICAKARSTDDGSRAASGAGAANRSICACPCPLPFGGCAGSSS